ncbi:MAG: hypothetical protein COA79_08965 [Planctomycetota bacterium]|nr:MAG: hypothetical protein COA79_08965 [Planctomycetota bacterium]
MTKEVNKLLNTARKEINKLDDQLIELLSKRSKVVIDVTMAKKKNGTEIFAPERELDLLSRLEALGIKKGLDLKMIQEVYRAIIEGSKRDQAKIMKNLVKIGYQSPRGSFSEIAADLQSVDKHLQPVSVPYEGVKEIFEAVIDGKLDFGIVPYQSSFEIGVDLTVDLLLNSDVNIVGDVLLPLDIAIISPRENLKLEKVEKVYGTTWLFTRLEKLINKHLPKAQKCEIYSNSFYLDAIQDIDYRSVALGSPSFAKKNRLKIIKKWTANQTGLESRYAVIGNHSPAKSGCDMTTLAIELPNENGCLHRFTGLFAKANISVLNINLIYLRRKYCEHVFIVDILGHIEEKPIKAIMKKIDKMALSVKVLGSYAFHEGSNKRPAKLNVFKDS